MAFFRFSFSFNRNRLFRFAFARMSFVVYCFLSMISMVLVEVHLFLINLFHSGSIGNQDTMEKILPSLFV